MKKSPDCKLLSLALLLSGAQISAAQTLIDFETVNSFSNGSLSTDVAYSGNSSLKLDGGQFATYTLPAQYIGVDLTITMQVFDQGKWIDRDINPSPGNVLGPRWGVSSGAPGANTHVGLVVGDRNSGGLTSEAYYHNTAQSPAGTPFTIAYYGLRPADVLTATGGSQVDGAWVPHVPELGTDGGWVKWTFGISAINGEVTFYNGDGGTGPSVIPSAQTADGIDTIYLNGGNSGHFLSGMYVDDVTITAVPEPSTYGLILSFLLFSWILYSRRNG